MKKFQKKKTQKEIPISFEEQAESHEPTDDERRHMTDLLRRQIELTKQVYAAYAHVQVLNTELSELRRKTIPEYANQIGQLEYQLSTGEKAVIKKEIEANISDKNKPEAYKFLEDSGAGSLIKNTITISYDRTKDDIKLLTKTKSILRKFKIGFDIKKTLHGGTLKKHVRECREKGIQLDEKLFGVYENMDTVIDGRKCPKISNTPLKEAVHSTIGGQKK
jgi:hypothetical protein